MAASKLEWDAKVQGVVNPAPANQKLTFTEANELVTKFDANAVLIDANTTGVATNVTDIATNVTDIATNTANFSTLLEEKMTATLLEPTIVSGAYTFDVSTARKYLFTITEATTLTMPTLANSTNIVFSANITGDFVLTTNATELGDTYDGTISNRLTFECTKTSAGTQTNIVSIENLS